MPQLLTGLNQSSSYFMKTTGSKDGSSAAGARRIIPSGSSQGSSSESSEEEETSFTVVSQAPTGTRGVIALPHRALHNLTLGERLGLDVIHDNGEESTSDEESGEGELDSRRGSGSGGPQDDENDGVIFPSNSPSFQRDLDYGVFDEEDYERVDTPATGSAVSGDEEEDYYSEEDYEGEDDDDDDEEEDPTIIHHALIPPERHGQTLRINVHSVHRPDETRIPTTIFLHQGRLQSGAGLFTLSRVKCSTAQCRGYGLAKDSVWALKVSNVDEPTSEDEDVDGSKMRDRKRMLHQFYTELGAYMRIASMVHDFEERMGFAYLMELEAMFVVQDTHAMVFVGYPFL